MRLVLSRARVDFTMDRRERRCYNFNIGFL